MAVSFSNHSLFSPRLSSSSLKSSEEPKLPFLTINSPYQKPLFSKLISGFSPSKLSFPSYKQHRRPTLIASLPTQESASTDDVRTSNLPSLKAMIRVYKEALLSGDDRIVSEIESRINLIEKEKNELEKKVLEMSAEITTGKEKFIRLQADFDNFRKRSEKERLTTRSDAQGEVIESLLPMVDSFERAKEQIKPETEKETKIDTSYQGIYKQFVEIMRSLRVAVVPTVGKPFDPSLHEAIAREESQKYKEGIIIQEFRRGFLLGDQLIRPAMVKVSSGPGNKRVSVASEKSSGQPATTGVDE
ncbi:GrpE nucleotide exchange factor [Corchorus capsularis]|uniref:GrpE protein homolog n=1 Tax=Corchorus capsularis TaxID=210143 RepID=A0A1R3JLL6_COCAP|nr:GrpE nucleotide exchange factor [Corchorus capsularis]